MTNSSTTYTHIDNTERLFNEELTEYSSTLSKKFPEKSIIK